MIFKKKEDFFSKNVQSTDLASLNISTSFHKKNWLIQNYMYGLKIAGTDQVSFGPVPVLMVVKIIWSTESK